MEKLPYLKDALQTNIPKLVTITKRVGTYPETDYVTKEPTGRMQTLYNFRLPDGSTVRHYAKEREEETLGLFQAGETVQVVRQEQVDNEGKRYSFLVWTPQEGAEARAAASPQQGTNTHIDGEKRKLEERQRAEDKKWDDIATSKIIHNFMVEGYKLGKDASQSAKDALLFYQEQKRAVSKAILNDELGMDVPVVEHKGTVAVEKLPEDAFGADISY